MTYKHSEYVEKRTNIETKLVALLTEARLNAMDCHLDKALENIRDSEELIEREAPPVAGLHTQEEEAQARLRLFLFDIRRIYLAGIPDALVDGCRGRLIRVGEKP